jgi:hypothetical protein
MELDRQRQIEEEKKRREEEAIRKAEEAKMKAAEDAMLVEEGDECQGFLVDLSEELTKVRTRLKREEEWVKYLECSKMPEPTSENQMTANITLMSEAKYKTLEDTLEKCQETEQIVQNIKYELGDSLEDSNRQKRLWCYNYINTLRSLCRRKIDEITGRVIEYIEDHLISYPESSSPTLTSKGAKATVEAVMLNDCFVKHLEKDIKVGIWINSKNIGYKTKPIDFGHLMLQADLPRQYQEESIIMRVIWTSFDSQPSNRQSPYMTVGGIYEVNLFGFPTLPKRAKKWLMRQVKPLDELLALKPFPANEALQANILPQRMSYQLPSYIYLSQTEDLNVAWWDTSINDWTNRDVTEAALDLSTKILSFKIKKLAPMALLLSKTIDFPYIFWFLRAVSNDRVLLDLEGKRMTFGFVITPGGLEFVDKLGIPELQHLQGVTMPPGYLLLELSRCGVHLLPTDDDLLNADVSGKNAESEERAARDIAYSVNTFSFRISKWNRTSGPNFVVARSRPNLEYDEFFAEDEEHDWRSLAWHPNKVQFTHTKETDEHLRLRQFEGHLNLRVLLQNEPAEVMSRLNNDIPVHLCDTVLRTLRLLRLLAFA